MIKTKIYLSRVQIIFAYKKKDIQEPENKDF